MLGRAETGSAGYVRLGTGCNVGQCTARSGRLGEVRHGLAGSGPSRNCRLGYARTGGVRHCPARQEWHGPDRISLEGQCSAMRCNAGRARLGYSLLGPSWHGWHGLVCSSHEGRDQAGLARLCAACQCVAHNCSAVTYGPPDSSGGPFQFTARIDADVRFPAIKPGNKKGTKQ